MPTEEGNKDAKDVDALNEPLSSDLKPGESATLEELRAKRNGWLSVEAVLGELKGETPSRRLLDRYLVEPNETKFEYLAKSVVYALVDVPHSERDKEAWREYAPVVEAALGDWERDEARA